MLVIYGSLRITPRLVSIAELLRQRQAAAAVVAMDAAYAAAAASNETEEADRRPRCETPVASRPDGMCGSEEGLRRIIYTPIPYIAPEPKDTVHCPRHFGDAWKKDNADRAEPIKTAKD